jgi:hypothetical protein
MNHSQNSGKNLDIFPTIDYHKGMKTRPPPPTATSLSPQLYYQLVYTLTALLPPPLDDSPEALRARNHTAIAKVAALLPVNANEIDLAAQCIAARAQAEDVLRLLRQNAHDLPLVIRLNAQYTSMVRTSLSVHARLMRVQAVRQKREAIDGAADQDTLTLLVAEQSMLKVADLDLERLQAARPQAAPGEVPKAAPAEAPVVAPAPKGDTAMAETVSENVINSHDMAFETWMSERPWNQGPGSPDGTDLRKRLREAMAGSRLAEPELSADGRASPTG